VNGLKLPNRVRVCVRDGETERETDRERQSVCVRESDVGSHQITSMTLQKSSFCHQQVESVEVSTDA
jgi:hypothetical protein